MKFGKNLVTVAFVLASIGTAVFATACVAPQYLSINLYQKNPTTWAIIPNGGIGTFKYNMFEFMGDKLAPSIAYTLIRYTEPTNPSDWAGTNGAVCLGTPQVKWDYSVLVSGKWIRYQHVEIRGNLLAGGAKVWLVLSSDVNCNTGKMIAWQPAKYLFEGSLI